MWEKKGHYKYDILEKDTWIDGTASSKHMSNLYEGMFNCHETDNQFIKVGSGEKVKILKKECETRTFVQNN